MVVQGTQWPVSPFDPLVSCKFSEPPVILPATLTEYTAVEGDKVEMKCYASGSPKPQIVWYKRSLEITEEDTGVQTTEDGTIIIDSVKDTDHGPYTCKAINPAGEASQDILLKVIGKLLSPDMLFFSS